MGVMDSESGFDLADKEIETSLALCRGYLKHLQRQLENRPSDLISQSLLRRKLIIEEQITSLNRREKSSD
jgi:hypothetical protein